MRTAGDGTATGYDLELQVDCRRVCMPGCTGRLGTRTDCRTAQSEHVPTPCRNMSQRPLPYVVSLIRRSQSYSLPVTTCSIRWMRRSRRSKVRFSRWSAIRRELV